MFHPCVSMLHTRSLWLPTVNFRLSFSQIELNITVPNSANVPDGAGSHYVPAQTYSLPKIPKNTASTLPEDMKTMSLKKISMLAPKSSNKNKGPSPLSNKKLNSQSMPQGLETTGTANNPGLQAVVSASISQSEEDLSREPLSDNDSDDEMVL